MMPGMPRPRPPHLHREMTRHGSVTWYVRIGKGRRTRIRAAFGTPEFLEEYQAAVAGIAREARRPVNRAGSLAWLIEQYRGSAVWMTMATATRYKYKLILDKMAEEAGNLTAAKIATIHIARGIDKRARTPFQANNYLKAVRKLFAWGVTAGHLETNPAAGVAAVKVGTTGFHAWTEAEIDRFEAHWKIGTRERLAMAIFLYSGLRRGDVAGLGRQHIRDGALWVTTEKTDTALCLPILPELQAALDAAPRAGLLFFPSGVTGKAMTKEGLGNWFGRACRSAGVPGSAHGLRKAGARRAAENGATQAQLKAIYGWTNDKVAAIYIRDADRARLAREGMAKLSRAGTSIPSPSDKVRARAKKSQ